MKNLFYLFLFVSLSSCKISAPTFKNLGQWQISKINGTQVTVSNVANFYNPNKIGGIKLNGINLAIQTEGKNLGKLAQDENKLTIKKMTNNPIKYFMLLE